MLLLAPPILLALTVHECAHAWTADKLGDPTAKMLGRVTLNPLKHLDPVGTIVLFVSGMFGWAKPVPVNHRNLKGRYPMLLVSAAGPGSNLFLAAVFALIFKLFFAGSFAMIVFSPSPSGGMDIYGPLQTMVVRGMIINVALAVFNMLPIPPLDGSKVLMDLLPPDKAFQFSKIEPYGMFILLGLLFTGLLGTIIGPVIHVTITLLTGGII